MVTRALFLFVLSQPCRKSVLMMDLSHLVLSVDLLFISLKKKWHIGVILESVLFAHVALVGDRPAFGNFLIGYYEIFF